MELTDFLAWLMGGGALIAASWIFERVEWFQNLESKTKELALLITSSVFAIGAFAIQSFVPAEIILQAAPYFVILSGIFSYVFLGKAFHKVDKE